MLLTTKGIKINSSLNKNMITYKVKIFGRVQGVGFRWFLRMKAKELGIRGYAENLPDGTVEVVAQADEKNEALLKRFLEECKKGPFLARVDKVIFEKVRDTAVFGGFQIK